MGNCRHFPLADDHCLVCEAEDKHAGSRDSFASSLADVIARGWDHAKVEELVTTSDCPLIRITFLDGDVFNITITRARS